jgi:hypothetical protein
MGRWTRVRKGTPSQSPSLAGIEGSGLREETSPEPRRGELKERRGGGEDGGGKNRSWSSVGAGGSIPRPTPPTSPSPRSPPARRGRLARRPASLPGAVSHAPFVFPSVGLWLSLVLDSPPALQSPEQLESSFLESRKALTQSTPRIPPLSLPQPPPPPSQNNTAASRRPKENNLEG